MPGVTTGPDRRFPVASSGDDLSAGDAPCSATNEDHVTRRRREVVDGGKKVGHHALDRRPGQLLMGGIGTEAAQHARGTRSVGGALAVEVRNQHEAASQ